MARPFAYNPSHTPITGTAQLGDLAIGMAAQDYSINPGGVTWWNGPDEIGGYIICAPVSAGNQPTPIGSVGTVGFWRSTDFTDATFISLVNTVFAQNFSTGATAKSYLTTNGYWTNYTGLGLLLLDLYPGPRDAFSVRQLRTSYMGYCLRVRRSSDGTTKDIGFVDGLLDTATILTFVGSNKGTVVYWYDQSDNANDLQALWVEPVICNGGVINVWGTKPVIKWDGTNSMGFSTPLAKQPLTITQPCTYFLVEQNTSGSVHYTDGYAGRQIVSGSLIYAGSSLACTTPATPHTRYALFNGASSQSCANNLTMYTGAAGANSLDYHYSIGLYRYNTASIVGGFQEIIVYQSNKSAIQTTVRDNQNSYFAIY